MARNAVGVQSLICLLILYCVGCAQQNPGTNPQTAPTKSEARKLKSDFDHSRFVKFQGVLKNHGGERVTGIVGVLFAIYEQQEGGPPLWQEVQNVEADDRGHFTAVVGATRSEGILPALFDAAKTRWLGNQVMLPGEVEQSRIRLVSTSEGLVAERAVKLVLPEESGNQPAAAEAQEAQEVQEVQEVSAQDADSPTGKSLKQPFKSSLRLRHRRLTP
jgi:hypothetical protein